MEKNYLVNQPVSTEIQNHLLAESNAAHVGAQVSFIGCVRADDIDAKKVVGIEYSAYPEMVNKEFDKIIADIMAEFNDVHKILIRHAIGMVKVGENAMVVTVAAGHRNQVYDALKKTVNLIKERVPIWKKEFFADDEYRWTDNSKLL